MVNVNNISKTYNKGAVKAVNDVSFSVEKGELFGLIGPDGAGKSSIFRILTTLLLPDSGGATVAGYDVVKDYRQIRSSVGYMPGRFSLYPDLSIEENLHFFATVFNTTVAENYHLIEDIYVQIEPFKKRRAGKLSGGMKQKLALCCALIHKPTVLFLDEPTTGVDPVSRKEFWEMLKRLKQQGITIVVSTPYMDEATRCDRIALIQGGSILSINPPQQIVTAYPSPLYAVKATDMPRVIHVLATHQPPFNSYLFGEYIHVDMPGMGDQEAVQVLTDVLAKAGLDGIEVNPVTPTIEDCFIKLLTT
ncbi:ABC transporter ATP-binding protein [Parapedobacter indicus]|uniref:ABC-type multidrug transport system, ATPase component n=1 Tax=Parapedobacter indicus TaxID=1477437 RepID=A0A1I3EYV9_9SPHI|nr:ABC transporter ATP-binding protein [Parapedobacter indicus]PPL03478.1 ABC-type multidrug transport system ATPase subunit [Parapedobacter indicus]SFI04132.1 ABC-type multidrug transport system, ATPase component [Parapedobacter indicus]